MLAAAGASSQFVTKTGNPDRKLAEMEDRALTLVHQGQASRTAVAKDNLPEVRRLAHLMKGSSANIGAERLAACYQDLKQRIFCKLLGTMDRLCWSNWRMSFAKSAKHSEGSGWKRSRKQDRRGGAGPCPLIDPGNPPNVKIFQP